MFLASILFWENIYSLGAIAMSLSHAFWISYWGAFCCKSIGHQTPRKLPYQHMPNKTYYGCSRCESNMEDTYYGEDATQIKKNMLRRRIVFEIVFWSFWVFVFMFFMWFSTRWL